MSMVLYVLWPMLFVFQYALWAAVMVLMMLSKGIFIVALALLALADYLAKVCLDLVMLRRSL
jgi:hypothetical protein